MPLHSWRTLTRGVSARPRRREAREQLFILWESGRKRGAGVRACEERKWPAGGGNTLRASGGLWGGNEDVWGERSRVWVNRTEITFICKCAIYKYRFEVEEWRASSSAEVPVYKMSTGLSTLLLGSKEMWDMRRAVKLLNQSTGSNVSKGAPTRSDTRPRRRARFQEPAAGHWGREIPSMFDGKCCAVWIMKTGHVKALKGHLVDLWIITSCIDVVYSASNNRLNCNWYSLCCGQWKLKWMKSQCEE